MNFIVFDVEATCWETERERYGKTQEIIEIGAVKIDEYGDVLGEYEAFVRPVVHTQLTPFCTRLTSITQVDVNQADTFDIVAEDFRKWVMGDEWEEEEYLFCSWGFFDQRILAKNCILHKMDEEWTKPHINLKYQYPRVKGLARTIGLKRAVEAEGFDFEGAHHRGIDDAINLAKIFVKYQTQWRY